MKCILMMAVLILCQGFSASMFSRGAKDQLGGDRGLLLGFGGSNFVGASSSSGNHKFMPGITFGFYQDFRINTRFCLETGLQFCSKGSRLDAVGDLYLHQVLTYVEVPVLAGWTLFSFGKSCVFLAGGPYFGVKLLAFNEVGFPEDVHKFDLGLDLGVGVKWQKCSFRLEVKRGLHPVDQSVSPPAFKNLSVSLLAGISFGNINK
jgi:hypothetical protein